MLGYNKLDNKNAITMKTLPKIGYIAFYNKVPVAAGFLARVEPNMGMLDSFTSNPYLGSQIRHEALKLVIDTLIDDAKRMKLKRIIAMSKDSGILNRALELGFVHIPYQFTIKQL